MKTLCCPVNGPRDIGEFAYGGVVAESPAADADTLVWANFVFMQDNVMGDVIEWWLHTPSGVWLIAERNTRTDTFGRVWLAADYLREARAAASTPDAAGTRAQP